MRKKQTKKVSFSLDKTMKTALEKGDHRSSSGSTASSNANARIVREATKDTVTTPQVDDRSPNFFSHSNTKPKRNLPSNSRKAALNLPPKKSTLWKTFDETVLSTTAEPFAIIRNI